MSEYITKEQAVEVVNTAFGHIYDSDSDMVCLVDLQNEIIMTIEQHTEPADVAPVVHGKWVFEDVDLICSNCGMDAPTEGDYRQVRSSYCPCCGARMDGYVKPQQETTEEYSREPGTGSWDCSDEEYNYSGYIRDVINRGW